MTTPALSFAARPFLQEIPWSALPACPQAPFSAATHCVFKVVGPEGDEGRFTGYYEPHLKGSYTRDDHYRFPVYAPPSDLDGYGPARPYPLTRADITAGALNGRGLEILYLDDEADLFFMHVQGSGAVLLPDGRLQRLSFAGKTHHPYTAIGAILKERGALSPSITMQSIRAWLKEHPAEQTALFNGNASYIFFRAHEAPAPLGGAGTPLVAEESLAIDDALYPYGLDVMVATRDPLAPDKPFIRMMRTADKGSAIKGLIRGDIYFGSGDRAGEKAGRMNAKGCLYVFLQR